MQKLPIGLQYFAELRQENYVYVDKTALIYDLLNAGKFIFQQLPAYPLAELTADSKLLDSADVNDISVISLLFQTGYLTIKTVHPSFLGDNQPQYCRLEGGAYRIEFLRNSTTEFSI